jgi:putative FmdB family regulatory protein
MPTYDFECEPCAYYTEIKQGPSEPSTQVCPLCKNETLMKVFITAPHISVRGEAKTIGQIADRNTKKMGTYELEHKNKANNMDLHQKHKEVSAKRRKINKMTPEQKVKWIKDGD